MLGLLHDIIILIIFFLIFNQYFERGKPQRKTKIAVLAKIVMGRQFCFLFWMRVVWAFAFLVHMWKWNDFNVQSMLSQFIFYVGVHTFVYINKNISKKLFDFVAADVR